MTAQQAQDTAPQSFGALLRRYRGSAGLTQQALAERAGLSVRGLSDLERGVISAPRAATVHLLAAALRLTPTEQAVLEAARKRSVTPPAEAAGGVQGLPLPPTPLVGRAAEVAAMLSLVRRAGTGSGARLVTLTGTGGVGKTRLALEVAAELRAEFTDGVCFVPLAPVSDPGLVASTIAQTLGLHEADNQPLQELLVGYLRGKEVLLVLDNFEQVVTAAPLVGTLLAAAPRLTVLVTSRSVLRLYGEQEYPVPPLRLPPLSPQPEITVLRQSEAVALFMQQALLSKPDFAMTKENAPAVAEICVRLDGLPLAIELAAARVKLLPPPALLARLESRLTMLTGGARDRPARQQTLRGALDWSYTLLDRGEQTLFTWLSVFVGGCTLAAAEEVCTRAGGLPLDVLDGLSSLVDKSLLRQEEDTTSGEPRFLMLETIREYAQERLIHSGAEGTLRAAHAGHFLVLAEEAQRHLWGARQVEWLARLEREHDNLRAVVRWARDGGDSLMGLRVAGALWRFWLRRGHLSEGRRWLEGLLGQREPAEPSGDAVQVRATALNGAGFLAYAQSDYARATALAEESLALCRELGEQRGIAEALNTLGNVAAEQGDHARAQGLFEESLLLKRELGETSGMATLLNNLGLMAWLQSDYARATALQEESLALHRELGDTWGIALSLGLLGRVAQDQGDLGRAMALEEEGLALFQTVGDKSSIAFSLHNLGNVAYRQGDNARATALYTESLALRWELGKRESVADSLMGLAAVATGPMAAPEALERAARLVGAAAALRAVIGAPLPPKERAETERIVAALRAALGDRAWEARWAEGQVLTLEQAVALALGESSPA